MHVLQALLLINPSHSPNEVVAATGECEMVGQVALCTLLNRYLPPVATAASKAEKRFG